MTDRDTCERLLRQALALTAGAEPAHLDQVFTDDVRVFTPSFTTTSVEELLAELSARDEVMGELTVDVPVIAVDGDRAWAEWSVSARLVTALEIGDDVVAGTVGQPLLLNGATVAEFTDGRISSLRQYWNEADLLAELGLLPAE
jgi:ketosteroid isomerase-like protein